MEQVTDEQLFTLLDPETNSIAALESLSEVDLVRTVTISGEPHSVMQAVGPPGGALCASCSTDRSAGKTLRRPSMEVAECAQELIYGVQPAGGIGTEEPEINYIILKGFAKH